MLALTHEFTNGYNGLGHVLNAVHCLFSYLAPKTGSEGIGLSGLGQCIYSSANTVIFEARRPATSMALRFKLE
jgi:hypothetical protein